MQTSKKSSTHLNKANWLLTAVTLALSTSCQFVLPILDAGAALADTQSADDATSLVSPSHNALKVQFTVIQSPPPDMTGVVIKSRNAYYDGILQYDFILRVGDAELTGTPMNLEDREVNYVMIADLIPEGTVVTDSLHAPQGWEIAYSTDDPAVTGRPSNDPNVVWTTSRPPNDEDIKRVVFLYDKAVATNTEVAGFSLRLLTTGTFNAAESNLIEEGTFEANPEIQNIVQVMGTSQREPLNEASLMAYEVSTFTIAPKPIATFTVD